MSEQKFAFNDVILIRRKNIKDVWDVYFYAYNKYNIIVTIGNDCFDTDNHEFLPYKGNEHLLGTTNDPKPEWKPKKGEVVKVKDYETDDWFYSKFNSINVNGRYISESMSGELFGWKYCEPLTEEEKGNA